MATVPLQICNGTDKCCKKFIILYSLFCLLSLHFFFSLLSHSPVPSLFSLHVSRRKLRRRFRLPPSISSVKHGNDKRLRFGLQSRRSPTRLNSLSTGHARSHPRSSHARSCRSHPKAAVDPLPSPLCPPFTLLLSGCGFLFFILLQFGLI